jgi:hypothetical protein
MWKKITFNNYFLAALILNALSLLAPVILRGFLPPVVPLFYGRPVGEGQLVSTLGLLIAPAASFLITAVNLLLNLWTKDDFLKKVLAVTALIISIVTAITVIKIMLLVGFF